MSSLLKQNTPVTGGLSPKSFLLRFEDQVSQMMEFADLEMLMRKLQYLGLHFDPFDQAVPTECQEIIKQLGLAEQVQNPYEATNILLRLLDITEERLNQIKQ
jgi:hypothetical protein